MVGHIGLGKYRAYNLRYEMSSKSIRIYARSYLDLPMCAIFPSDFPECAVLIGTTLLEANIIQTQSSLSITVITSLDQIALHSTPPLYCSHRSQSSVTPANR